MCIFISQSHTKPTVMSFPLSREEMKARREAARANMMSAEDVIGALRSLLDESITINYSGAAINSESVYFKAEKGGDTFKVRISNHSVTNISRVFDEAHLSFYKDENFGETGKLAIAVKHIHNYFGI